MLHFDLNSSESGIVRPRVCAVSYLNTVPLVWGMLHGPQKDLFDVQFAVPSECADLVAAGHADIGIVPCAELPRLGLEVLTDVGIACHGPVRSILLVSRVEPAAIRTLAADASSRTSVQLTRIILSRRYGVDPVLIPMRPDLPSMLERADAALIIGDPALHLDPATIPFHVLDIGKEWVDFTGLPMVFALWAGAKRVITPEVRQAFIDSYRLGSEHLEEILGEAASRGVPEALARKYLTEHIVFEIGEAETRGLELFLKYAAETIHAGGRGGVRV